MDLKTTISILEVQLADTLELLGTGRGRTIEATDYDRALRLQSEELRATLRMYTDLQFSQSMNGAMPDNTPLNVSSSFVRDFEAIPRMTGAIPNDTPFGMALSAVRSHSQPGTSIDDDDRSSTEDDADSRISTDNEDRSSVEDDAGTSISTDNDDHSSEDDDADTDNAGEGSSRHVLGQCVACSDRVPATQGYTAPCSHIYCTDCTVRLFRDALRDESLFPPRCCRQEMVIGSVHTILGAGLTYRFNLKAIEHATPNKTYCCNPRFSRFILPDNIRGRRGVCTGCRTVTCVQCKQRAHNGDCEEEDDAVFQALTEAQGWRGCFRCRAVVELNIGCNHITCRCGAQFCYVCGQQWRTCECPQWDEARLWDRAEVIVQRAPPQVLRPHIAGRAVALARQQAIQYAAQNLRERHECTHVSWRYVFGGPHECEVCSRQLPRRINECRQCQLQACGRCRNNRL